MSAKEPGGVKATLAIARLTLRRTMRDRTTLLLIFLAAVPIVFVAILGHRWLPDNGWSRVINVTIVPLLAIIAPMSLAPLIAEEVSDRTYSYLWSRPIPRWSVIAGKGLALTPIVAILFSLMVFGSWLLLFGASGAETGRLWRAIFAVLMGVIAAGSLSAAIGVFVPKHSVAASAGYLLAFDHSVGQVPMSLSNVSISYHVRQLAGTGQPEISLSTHLGWLVGISLFALALLFWRIGRVEFAAQS